MSITKKLGMTRFIINVKRDNCVRRDECNWYFKRSTINSNSKNITISCNLLTSGIGKLALKTLAMKKNILELIILIANIPL